MDCRDCVYFKEVDKDKHGIIGECVDALKRAKGLVSPAVHMEIVRIYSFSGNNCNVGKSKN